MEKKLQTPYFINYNLLIVEDLWPLIINPYYNLAERIDIIKCKYGHDNKKCKKYKIKYKDCEYSFECTNFKDGLIKHKCFYCNKNYQKCLMKT